jgi:hypothetical protein
MKCQSDYDTKDQAVLRQADECIEAWWEPGGRDQTVADESEGSASTSVDPAKREALRRGLVRETTDGDTCLACAED